MAFRGLENKLGEAGSAWSGTGGGQQELKAEWSFQPGLPLRLGEALGRALLEYFPNLLKTSFSSVRLD